MNVMAQAHKMTKDFFIETKGMVSLSYARVFKVKLKQAHELNKEECKAIKKANARFMVEVFVKPGEYKTVDIRSLPTFSASTSTVPNEIVSGWTIKGSLHTGESWVTEQTSGFSAQTLKQNLSHWSRYVYKQLCLMVEIDGVMYRLVK